MRDASEKDETAHSVASTAKTGFNRLSFLWLAVAAVITLLGILYIIAKRPSSGAASPPSHTSLHLSTGDQISA